MIAGQKLVHSQNTTCDSDWIQFGQSCLRLYTTNSNFDAAVAICQNHSSQLVEIDNSEKEAFIENSVLLSHIRYYWIGLKDVNNDNKLSSYKWVNTGRSVVSTGYSNFGTGLSSDSNSNCTALIYWNTKWGWFEKTCQDQYYFICQSGKLAVRHCVLGALFCYNCDCTL